MQVSRTADDNVRIVIHLINFVDGFQRLSLRSHFATAVFDHFT